MSTLVSDIITEAFLDLQEIRVGRTIATLEQTDAFLRLNQIVASWSAEQLSVFGAAHTGLTVTAGTSDYTVGPAGTLVTAARPVRITGAAGVSGAFRQPVEVMSFSEFSARAVNDLGRTSVMAKMLAADQGFPSINIRLFPPPAASPAILWLDYWIAIAAFATVGDTVTLPPGYEKALHFALAVELYPQYPRSGAIGMLVAQAAESKAVITALNAQILGETQAPAPQSGGPGPAPGVSK